MTTPLLGDLAEFEHWFAAQQSKGQGYVEVGDGDSGYPSLTLSFHDGFGVVHWFPSAEQVLLLVGDGTVADVDAVDFPIEGELCSFTGRFISDVDRARRIAAGAIRAGSTYALGLWEPL